GHLLLERLAPSRFGLRRPPASTPFPCTTLFRSRRRSSLMMLLAVRSRGTITASAPAFSARETYSSRVTVVITSRAPSSLASIARSEEHTSELQSREKLVCRLLLDETNSSYTARE